MRTGYALFALLGLGLVFEIPMWPKSSDIKPEHYSHIQLSQEDSLKAIDSYRKAIHLNASGFYRDFFPLSNQKLTVKTYVWFIIAYATLALVTFLWFKEASEYSKDFVMMFLFLAVANLVDFLIVYNESYTKHVSFNNLSVIMYASFLMYKSWKQEQIHR